MNKKSKFGSVSMRFQSKKSTSNVNTQVGNKSPALARAFSQGMSKIIVCQIPCYHVQKWSGLKIFLGPFAVQLQAIKCIIFYFCSK